MEFRLRDVALGLITLGLVGSIGYGVSQVRPKKEKYVMKVKYVNMIAVYTVKRNIEGDLIVIQEVDKLSKEFVNSYHHQLRNYLNCGHFNTVHEIVHFIRSRNPGFDVSIKKVEE